MASSPKFARRIRIKMGKAAVSISVPAVASKLSPGKKRKSFCMNECASYEEIKDVDLFTRYSSTPRECEPKKQKRILEHSLLPQRRVVLRRCEK